MKSLLRILILIIIFPAGLSAQEINSSILLTVNGNDVSAGEFLWLYEKNNTGQSESTIEEYIDLYILFKLKVEAAKAEGLHQTESFKSELAGYRKQLSRNYLTDQSIKEELLQKAYERSKEEINAYHILVGCAADASPSDTLDAYEKAMKIRERIRLGEPFMSVARGASDDKTARFNGGKLGYFTVFQTPLNFENVVYSMKPGNLSRPVRTSEGYHIIKVQDRRGNSGRVKVAHIMKATPPGSSEILSARAKSELDSIYSLAISGSDFAELAKKYSDDKGSSSLGGELPWFGVGEMIHEFSEESFKLLRNGDISEPFRTLYGWHIVKRTEKQAPLPYEEARKVLESKMSQSYLESISKKSFVDNLKKEYNFELNSSNQRWLYSIADSVFRSGDYSWEEKRIPSSNIYTYDDRYVTMTEFTEFISKMGERAFSTDSLKFINTLIDLKSYDDLVKYEDSILEDKYPEFGFLVKEFHDGILLFEISNREIWSKISGDSTGLKSYWETRKGEFMNEAKVDARIYSISPDAGKSRAKKLTKVLKKLIKSDTSEEDIIELGTNGNRQFLTVKSGSFRKGENKTIDSIKWTKGTSVESDRFGTHIVYISNITEAKPISFDMAKSNILDDYQHILESSWHQQLREQYDVKINNSVLNRLIEGVR